MPSGTLRFPKKLAGAGRGPRFETVERRVLLSSYMLSTLADFDGSKSANPSALTVDSVGNLYGTTPGGGAYNFGAVFEVARGSNTITTLASFLGGVSGAIPRGGLTLDAAGNLYGTTTFGGAGGFGTLGAGTVFELARGTNTITTLASMTGEDGVNSASPVTLDAAGNLFGSTPSSAGIGGSSPKYGAVFELATGTHALTVIAAFHGTDGTLPVGRLTLDPAGNLFGTAAAGGPLNFGTVFEIARGSTSITDLATFNGTNGKWPSGPLPMDAAGNLYGTTSSGGPYDSGTVFEIASGTQSITILASFRSSDGQPSALTMDPANNLYGTTSPIDGPGDGTVFEIANGSKSITTLATFNGANGAYPRAVTLEALGNQYGTTNSGGADNDGTVFELTPNTTVTLTPASGGGSSHIGQPLTFTVSVTGNVPDGETITLLDASDSDAVVASGTLLDGSATLFIPRGKLRAGIHKLIAVYGGDANHGASESAPCMQTVSPFRPGRTP